MFDPKTSKKINEFVYQKPRTVQEVAQMLKVNWRTAERYVERIAQEEGILAVRTFREGTRGALKIVFWNNVERIHATEAQELLFKRIETGYRKEDFSPFDIYQFVDAKKKKMRILTDRQYNADAIIKEYANLLHSAKSQVMFFSGNLTFSTMASHDEKILSAIEELAEQKVGTKILTRVEIPGLKNIQNVLAANARAGWDAVEVRHCFQPLRATIVDSSVAFLKEKLYPQNYADGELKEKLYTLYYVYDPEWIEWLQKVFWHFFRNSVDAKVRIKDLAAAKRV
ncbi:MAG: hypothetical protein HYS81_05500 [Candidatus Aenigmatarchaeota archaeon]|nr:MAG: hypothetical protein HYS81_05500 [Candidatus Aenigmarchaeota archaeon]